MLARLRAMLPVLAAALWWGSMTATGFVLVPLLFTHLPAATAGFVAARLFAAQSAMSIACAASVLVLERTRPNATPRAQTLVLGLVITGLLLALLQQYGVAPRIVARHKLPLWHGLGTAMYALQWLCALVVLCRVTAARGASSR